jgi:large subunit ribosomal protein L5
MSKSLKERYEKELLQAVQKELGFENKFQSPRLVKVVVNVGLGDAAQNAKLLEKGVNELTQITGQKPVVTRAKKSIAGFKIRQGMPVGAMVTLRGERMFDFLNKLVCIVLPRIRDFRGLSEKGFDTRGNYNIGLKDQLVFPEINYDEVDRLRGLNITIVTTAQDDMAAKALLKHIGFPFRKASGGEGKEEQNTPAA